MQEEEDGACKGCGHPLDETTDAASEGDWLVGDAGRWVACHACRAAQQAQMKEAGVGPEDPRFQTAGALWPVVRKSQDRSDS